MLSIQIDEEKCLKDKLCQRNCPLNLIRCRDDSIPFVQTVKDFNQWCISCGHCVAVCPSGALSHSRMAPEECQPVNADQIPAPEAFELFLQNRRSIRRYKSTRPDRNLLQRLIAMTCHAPSGHNHQPVRWRVYDNQEQIQHMAGLVVDWMKHGLEERVQSPQAGVFRKVVQAWNKKNDLILHHTPCLVVAHSGLVTHTEPIDTAIALTYMDLASRTLGLGCCWAGIFLMAVKAWDPLASYLNLPEGHKVHGAMMVGYPRFNFKRAPLRKSPDIRWAGPDPALMEA